MLLLLYLHGCESEEGALLSIMGWESQRNLSAAMSVCAFQAGPGLQSSWQVSPADLTLVWAGSSLLAKGRACLPGGRFQPHQPAFSQLAIPGV